MKKNTAIIFWVVFLLLLFFWGKPLINFVASPQTVPQKPPVQEPSVPEEDKTIVGLVKKDLSQSKGIPVSQIKLVSIEEVMWTDSCLEYAREGEMCLQVITPGYKIILSDGTKTYEYHTNKSGKSMRSKEFKVKR